MGHLQLRDKERVEHEGEAVDLPSLMELWVMTKRMKERSHHILGNNTTQQSVINIDVVFLFSESPLAWSHKASDEGRVIWAGFGFLLITL